MRRLSVLIPPPSRVPRPSRRAFAGGSAGLTGFTLVELLVVIGIISLLIALLMPALAGARRSALTVQCASNLRTLGQAWNMYANQNKGLSCPGRLPTSGAPGGVYSLDELQYRPRWYELLGAVQNIYPCKDPKAIEDDSWTIESSLFTCPAEPDWNNSRNYPYGYNYQFLGNPRPKLNAPPGTNKWINWPVKASRISAAQTVMAADCMGTAAGKPRSDRTAYYSDGTKDPAAWGNKAVFLDPPRLLPTSDFADAQKRLPQHRSGPDPRHGKNRKVGRLNAAFCDGHVELVRPEDLGYVVNPDESIAPWGFGTHNRFFSGTGRNDDPPSVQ